MKLTLIVDRSGSMADLAEESTKQIQELLAKQSEDVRVNLIDFDDKIKVRAKNKKPGCKRLKEYKLRPRDLTSLYDAIGTAAGLIDPSERNFVVIITDGYENSSSRWTQEHVRPLIKAWQASGTEVTFIGAGIDSWGEASDLGLGYSLNVEGSQVGIQNAYGALGNAVNNYNISGISGSALYKDTEGVELKEAS